MTRPLYSPKKKRILYYEDNYDNYGKSIFYINPIFCILFVLLGTIEFCYLFKNY